MKPLNKLHDEELKFLDTINRISKQIYFTNQQNASSEHSKFLIEVIGGIEEQLESIRRNLEVSQKA